jgi:hypothetical protein
MLGDELITKLSAFVSFVCIESVRHVSTDARSIYFCDKFANALGSLIALGGQKQPKYIQQAATEQINMSES